MFETHIIPAHENVYALICEHIRHEPDGKKTYIGVSSSEFILKNEKEEISFDLYINIRFKTSSKMKKLDVAVCRNNKVVLAPIEDYEIVCSKPSKLKKNPFGDVSVESIEAVTSISELLFSDGDTLSILVSLGDHTYVAAALRVRCKS